MTSGFKPLLAASPWQVKEELTATQKLAVLRTLRYPVLATPKFDGIRVTTVDLIPPPGKLSVPVCRSLKQVPNNFIRDRIAELPEGKDGEVLTYDPPDLFGGPNQDITIETRPRNFNAVQSDVMSVTGCPTFRYMVFDVACMNRNLPYSTRVEALKADELPSWCIKVVPVVCNNADELMDYNEKCLMMGYEGICFRTPDSPPFKISSKDGRASLREQWLVKMKVFDKDEAEIIGVYEEMGNHNPITLGLKGNAERSSHKAGMVGKGTLGGFRVRDLKTGIEFNVGGGFDRAQREEFWRLRETLVNTKQVIQYMHQPHGAKEAPRIGIFTGFRNRIDL